MQESGLELEAARLQPVDQLPGGWGVAPEGWQGEGSSRTKQLRNSICCCCILSQSFTYRKYRYQGEC